MLTSRAIRGVHHDKLNTSNSVTFLRDYLCGNYLSTAEAIANCAITRSTSCSAIALHQLLGYNTDTTLYTTNSSLSRLLNNKVFRQVDDLSNLASGLQLKYRDKHTAYIRAMSIAHKYANLGSQSSVSLQFVILNLKVGRRVLPVRSLVNRSVRSFFSSPMNVSFKFMSPM